MLCVGSVVSVLVYVSVVCLCGEKSVDLCYVVR